MEYKNIIVKAPPNSEILNIQNQIVCPINTEKIMIGKEKLKESLQIIPVVLNSERLNLNIIDGYASLQLFSVHISNIINLN